MELILLLQIQFQLLKKIFVLVEKVQAIEKGAPFEGEVSAHRSHQVSDVADEVYIIITSFFV